MVGVAILANVLEQKELEFRNDVVYRGTIFGTVFQLKA